jgi:Holliday junction resolvase RusA-like endonuclease
VSEERDWHWFVLDINPEPWAIGPVGVKRVNGKMVPYVGRNTQLHMYKEAVREVLGDPGLFIEGKVELKFFFWRNRAEYSTPQARTHRKHEADGTNMAKSTEDALQGVLFKNDKDTNHMQWTVVEQGPNVKGRIVIAIRQGTLLPDVMEEFPDQVGYLLDELDKEESNEWFG